MKILFRALVFMLASLSAYALYAAESQRGTVSLISNSNNRASQAIADALQSRLTQAGFAVNRPENNDNLDNSLSDSDIAVGIGNEGTRWLEASGTRLPVLTISTRKHDENHKDHAHLDLKQPLCRQIQLIAEISNDFETVSIITGSDINHAQLNECAQRANLVLRFIERRTNEAVNSLIKRALKSDVLLATPDSEVYNRRTIKNVLLLSYRNRIPVIGFSKSFVQAGALAALHSSPETISDQATSLIEQRIDQGKFEQSHYTPRAFEVSINKQVKRSLGITMPSAIHLEQSLTGGKP